MSRLHCLAIVAFALLAGCERGQEHHADWVIRSQVVFLSADRRTEREPPAAGAFRLWFPYVTGDLYGAPTTGSFYNVALQPDRSFALDLNIAHAKVLKSLHRTAFSVRGLSIAPAEARFARLLPFVMQADGIEPLGQAEWIDADTKRPLMLLYVDRKARISGRYPGTGHALVYDIEAGMTGYIWVEEREGAGTIVWARSRPSRVVLGVMADEGRIYRTRGSKFVATPARSAAGPVVYPGALRLRLADKKYELGL